MDDIAARDGSSKRMSSSPRDIFGSINRMSLHQSMADLYEPAQTLFKKKSLHVLSVRHDSTRKETPKRVNVEDIFSEAEFGADKNLSEDSSKRSIEMKRTNLGVPTSQ